MTKEEWSNIREELITKVQDFEKQFGENNCQFVLDRNGDDPTKCVLDKCGHKYKNFYVFNNEFFNIFVDEWFHNYGTTDSWKVFPRGYKSGLQKVIKQFCEEHNLYYELRKAYRATVDRTANTCVFLVCNNN